MPPLRCPHCGSERLDGFSQICSDCRGRVTTADALSPYLPGSSPPSSAGPMTIAGALGLATGLGFWVLVGWGLMSLFDVSLSDVWAEVKQAFDDLMGFIA